MNRTVRELQKLRAAQAGKRRIIQRTVPKVPAPPPTNPSDFINDDPNIGILAPLLACVLIVVVVTIVAAILFS